MAVGNGKLSKAASANGGALSGGLRTLLNGGRDYEKAAQEAVEALKKEFPIVAEILGGLPATADSPAVAPGTVTIYVHEGRARFTINVKSYSQTLFGDVEDLVNIWGSINCALLTGAVSSKRFTERPSTSGNEADIPH